MTMQEGNGAEVGNIHKSDYACAEIISHIAKEMCSKFVCNVNEMDSITISQSQLMKAPFMAVPI